MINDGYYVNWLVDGLPGATKMFSVTADDSGSSIVYDYYDAGFPLGVATTLGLGSSTCTTMLSFA
eukprot:3938477-Amphidinium_carterae.1